MCVRMQGYLRPTISGLDALISDVQQLQTDSLASTAACKLWFSAQWLNPCHALGYTHGSCMHGQNAVVIDSVCVPLHAHPYGVF